MSSELPHKPNNNDLAVLLSPKEVAKDLEGFTFTPSDGIPSITLDNQRRLYFNSPMRRMFGLKPYGKVAIGYNADTKSIAIVTKNIEIVPPTFAYVLDKRCYVSARRFVRDNRINVGDAPIKFYFERNSSVDGVYVFRAVEERS